MPQSIKISFIIPVYNVEPYLRKCVDSLLSQDYREFEIIIVDDGSPDGCPQICDDYASQYSNVRVIHQQNGGLSAARNTGIDAANGEYICFVDSDDFWQPNVLARLMGQIEREQLDVLRFDYQNVRYNESGKQEIFRPNEFAHLIEKLHDEVDGKTYLNQYMDYECYAWQFILKRKLACKFTPGIHYEDVEWMPRMMLSAQHVNSTSIIVYNYLIRPGSIAHQGCSFEGIIRNLEGILVGMKTITSLIPQYPHVSWLRKLHSSTTYDILCTIAKSLYHERRKYISQLKKLNAFPLEKFKVSHQGARKVFIVNHFGPYMFCFIMHYRYAFKKLLHNNEGRKINAEYCF